MINTLSLKKNCFGKKGPWLTKFCLLYMRIYIFSLSGDVVYHAIPRGVHDLDQ